jgi:hypothetical protein
MHEVPAVHVMNVIGPLFAAVVFVAVMSLIREPARRNLNAVLVAGSTLAYLGGGFGVWELVYPAIATPIAYFALGSYRLVGIGWLMHAGWDVLHHLYGHPIWPFMPTSSFGCFLFDSAIAVWFLAGAPSIDRRLVGRRHAVPTGGTSGRS